MANEPRSPEKSTKDVILRDSDGTLYKIPREKLSGFRLSEKIATDLKTTLTWKTEVLQEDPFLFKPVKLEGNRMAMMMPGTGWCACRGKCNCFCGYCSCA